MCGLPILVVVTIGLQHDRVARQLSHPGFGLRVLRFALRISGFGFLISGSRFRDSGRRA